MAPPPCICLIFKKIHVFILRECAGIAATGVCRLLPPPVSQALTATQNKHVLRECAGIAATHIGRGKSVSWHCRRVDLPVPGLAGVAAKVKGAGRIPILPPFGLALASRSLLHSTVAGIVRPARARFCYPLRGDAGRIPILPPPSTRLRPVHGRSAARSGLSWSIDSLGVSIRFMLAPARAPQITM